MAALSSLQSQMVGIATYDFNVTSASGNYLEINNAGAAECIILLYSPDGVSPNVRRSITLNAGITLGQKLTLVAADQTINYIVNNNAYVASPWTSSPNSVATYMWTPGMWVLLDQSDTTDEVWVPLESATPTQWTVNAKIMTLAGGTIGVIQGSCLSLIDNNPTNDPIFFVPPAYAGSIRAPVAKVLADNVTVTTEFIVSVGPAIFPPSIYDTNDFMLMSFLYEIG